MTGKTFALRADQIKPLVKSLGRCIASDRITVGGLPVGYMYREETKDREDSGWCFFAGDEREDYNAVAGHFEIYDVNTIANYDPEIIPYLMQPPGAAFYRDATGQFKLDTGRPIRED